MEKSEDNSESKGVETPIASRNEADRLPIREDEVYIPPFYKDVRLISKTLLTREISSARTTH